MMELKNKELLRQAYEMLQTKKNNQNRRWDFPNQMLYDLCSMYPSQEDIEQVVAKIWLIGRSYAASVERIHGVERPQGDIYYDHVAPAICKIAKPLQDAIENLNKQNCLDENNFTLVLETHRLLEMALHSAVSMNMTSLASKYLHFHCRNVLPIYDSYAYRGAISLVKKDSAALKAMLGRGIAANETYADFVMRFLFLQNKIVDQYGKSLSLREMDFLLQNWGWRDNGSLI